jgi:restriction endonuclease S subunit
VVPPELDNEIASTGFCVLRAAERVLPKYIYFAVRSPTFINGLCGLVSGALYPAVTESQVLSQRIPVPPIDEQRRIVDLLTRAENVVRMRREAEQKAKEIIPALFLDMFGDPARNPKGWDIARVEDCCTLVRGSSPRPQGDPRYFGGPVPRLMIADITRDGIYVTPRIDSLTPAGAERSRPMKCGDVVMAVSGACGLPAILAVDACIHDGFVGFRSLNERIRAEYLYTFLAVIREETEKQAVGATFQNLKTDQIRAWKIPIPPIQIQDSFVARAKSLRRLGDDIAHASRYADSTFQSLLTLVFGEAV